MPLGDLAVRALDGVLVDEAGRGVEWPRRACQRRTEAVVMSVPSTRSRRFSYTLVASYAGVFNFGGSTFCGSLGGYPPAPPSWTSSPCQSTTATTW